MVRRTTTESIDQPATTPRRRRIKPRTTARGRGIPVRNTNRLAGSGTELSTVEPVNWSEEFVFTVDVPVPFPVMVKLITFVNAYGWT